MSEQAVTSKRYLGDAVYVDFDGYSVVLTTEDGIRSTNTIYLESGVMQSLLEYFQDLKAKMEGLGK